MLHVVASATQREGDGSIPQGRGPADEKCGTWWRMCSYLTVEYLWHAVSPDSHTLPSALGWKRTFGSRGRPRSPVHGGKEALTESEAVPLCRPHRTSHLGRGVREHSPHHYQNKRRSNSKVRERACHLNDKKKLQLTVECKSSAALVGCHSAILFFLHSLKLEWGYIQVTTAA